VSFWKSLGKGVAKSMGIPIGDKGPKMPKMPKDQKMSKQVVGKSNQAGGGKINFNTEEMLPEPAATKAVKATPVKQPMQTTQQKIKTSLGEFQDRILGSRAGSRSEAAKRLLKDPPKSLDGGSQQWL